MNFLLIQTMSLTNYAGNYIIIDYRNSLLKSELLPFINSIFYLFIQIKKKLLKYLET